MLLCCRAYFVVNLRFWIDGVCEKLILLVCFCTAVSGFMIFFLSFVEWRCVVELIILWIWGFELMDFMKKWFFCFVFVLLFLGLWFFFFFEFFRIVICCRANYMWIWGFELILLLCFCITVSGLVILFLSSIELIYAVELILLWIWGFELMSFVQFGFQFFAFCVTVSGVSNVF